MKSLEAQLAELKETIIPAEVKAGFTEASAQIGWKDAMSGKSIEEQLSIAKDKAKKLGLTESKRIKRNNGSAINESASEDRTLMYMKKGSTVRESYIMCGLPDPGPNAKQPAAFTESLVTAWKKYCGGFISDADARTLASRGISPE